MLRQQLLAAAQQQHPHCLHHVLQLQQLLPAAVAAALPQQQQQQQHHHLQCCSSQQQRCYASTSYAAAAEASTSSKSDTKPAIRYPTKHERRVANLAFCQARAAWRREVKALRLQWLSEIKQQKTQQRAVREEVREEIARLQELRSAEKAQDKEKKQLEQLVWEAERHVENAERRVQAARREELRQQTLTKHRGIWRQELEAASRTWIAPQDLQARIAQALDNPQQL